MMNDAMVAIDRHRPLILFDGHCNLCNGAVTFIIERDPSERFQFAALSWPAGDRLKRKFPMLEGVDSIVYFDGTEVFVRSSAALKVASKLGGLWPLLGIFWIVPRPIRDGIYNWVARNRYKWFGKQEQCMLPTPSLQNRFLRK